MLWLQRCAGKVHGGDPPILVVDRAQHHRHAAAVRTPDQCGLCIVAAHHPHRAVALQRILAGRFAHLGERIVLDAGQAVEGELAQLAAGHVRQPQLLRERIAAADTGAHVLEFLVTGFGDVLGHLAGGAGVRAFDGGGHQQPAAVRRQRAASDVDILAEVDGRGRAGGIGHAPGVVLQARSVAPVAVVLEGFDQAQLAITQVIGLRRLARCILGLHLRGLHRVAAIPAIPNVVVKPNQGAVAAPQQACFRLKAAGQLGQRTTEQVAHEHIAIADEGAAVAGCVEQRIGCIEVSARVAIQHHRRAALNADLPGVADGRALALLRVLRSLAVPTPPRIFHRRPDPVRVGHGLGQGQWLGRRGGHAGEQQGEGEGSKAHGAIRDGGRGSVTAVPEQACA